MEWKRFADVDPIKIKGLNCAIFRIKRKKFVVGRLKCYEYHPDDKKEGLKDCWHWVTDHGCCHDADVDDRICILPVLEVTVNNKY